MVSSTLLENRLPWQGRIKTADEKYHPLIKTAAVLNQKLLCTIKRHQRGTQEMQHFCNFTNQTTENVATWQARKTLFVFFGFNSPIHLEKEPIGSIWKVEEKLGRRTFCLSCLSSLIRFVTDSLTNSRLPTDAKLTLAARHWCMASCYAPRCFKELLSRPVGCEAKHAVHQENVKMPSC